MTDDNHTLIRILLVEDNPADIELVREAFEESSFANDLHVIEDGAEALEYLDLQAPSGGLPDIMLLDINLPGASGLEVLRRVKESDALRTIPVIMLTSSEDDHDIMDSYRNYCSGFVSKPVEVDAFIDVVRSIEGFWFALVKKPHQAGPHRRTAA